MEVLRDTSSSSEKEYMKDLSNISGTDRFSSLPDSILLEILSFLDMKEVGMASLVSRRCRYLWRSVPRLNFDHRHWKRSKKGEDNPGFVKMVDHVLEHRDHNASSVQELRLSGHSYCSLGKINDWVMNAAIGNTKKLALKFACYNSKEFKFPDVLFTSKLEAFNLVVSRSSVRLPDSMCVASQLKTLHLKGAKLPKGDSNGKLVLSCPILESLSLISCRLKQIKILNISAPQLKNLVVENDGWNSSSCNIEIHTPELISVHFKGELYKGYSLGILSSLVNAKIEPCNGKINEKTLISIMEGIRHATNVELSCQSIRRAQDMSAELVNTYTPIKSLRLIGCSEVSSATIFQNLLRWSPRIESLSLEMNLVQATEDWGEVFVFIRHLKFLEIREIKGCPEELKFFKFLFEHAVALREFTAVSAYGGEKIIEFSKKIHSLPKASSSLRIRFIQKRICLYLIPSWELQRRCLEGKKEESF